MMTYPVLSPKETANNLVALGFGNITPEHLLKINQETASSLYEFFARYFFDPDDSSWESELQRAAFTGLEVLEDVEWHRDSIRIVNLLTKVRKVMHAAGVHDFSTKDMFKPDPQRTVKLLSALINFTRYRDEKVMQIGQPLEECEQMAMYEIELQSKKEELERKIAEIEAERQSRQPEIQTLESENKELQQTILSLNKQQSNLQVEVRNLNKKINDYTDKISNAKYELLQKKQEASKQRSLIVQSPDKLQKTLEEKRSLKMELNSNVQSATEASQKWDALLEAYSKAHKKVTKGMALIQALQEQINSCKAIEKNVKALKTKLKEAEKEDWSLEAQRVELQVKAEQLEKVLKNMELENEIKYKEADKELDAVRSQVSPRFEQLALMEKKIQEKHSEEECVRRRITELSDQKESILRRLASMQMALIEKVKKYNSRVSDALKRQKMFTEAS